MVQKRSFTFQLSGMPVFGSHPLPGGLRGVHRGTPLACRDPLQQDPRAELQHAQEEG